MKSRGVGPKLSQHPGLHVVCNGCCKLGFAVLEKAAQVANLAPGDTVRRCNKLYFDVHLAHPEGLCFRTSDLIFYIFLQWLGLTTIE